MTDTVTWTRETELDFPCYRATINGLRLTVWRREPAYWQIDLRDRGQECVVDNAVSVEEAKILAVQFARRAGPVVLRQVYREGLRVWAASKPNATRAEVASYVRRLAAADAARPPE